MDVLDYHKFTLKTLNTYFSSSFEKTITCLNERLEGNKDQVLSGCNTMFHVFWTILCYTNNLTYTLSQSEKAVLLYSEFIIMSKNPEINRELHFIPDSTDAINFSYKKTIGNICLKDLKLNKKFSYKNHSILFLKMIYLDFFLHDLTVKSSILTEINKLGKLFEKHDIFNLIVEKYRHVDTKHILGFLKYLVSIKNYNPLLIQKKLLLYTN